MTILLFQYNQIYHVETVIDYIFSIFRDAEIIYGKIFAQKTAKRKRKTDSSIISSKVSTSEGSLISLRELSRNKVYIYIYMVCSLNKN